MDKGGHHDSLNRAILRVKKEGLWTEEQYASGVSKGPLAEKMKSVFRKNAARSPL